MKWYTMLIICYLSIAVWAWIGTDMIPEAYNPYTNLSGNGSLPYQLLTGLGLRVGNSTSGEVGPGIEGFMTANASRQQELMTTAPQGALGIAAEGLSAFLGSAYGSTIGYILGLVDTLSRFASGMTIILTQIGVPAPWNGMLGGLWNIMFLVALASLITGRDT